MLIRLNGLAFNAEARAGRGSRPPLLLLHGFTGSVRSWDEVRPRLAESAQVVALDVIGHGCSAAPAEPERYSFAWSVRDLSALLDALGHESVDLLGYSMGGRLALQFALEAPRRVRSLILESASPGIEDEAERRRRAHADDELARRIERHGVAAFVDEWERQPLLQPAAHVSAERRAALRAIRLRNSAVGLANSLRGMGVGEQLPLWGRLAELRMRVQLIVGERDTRYREIATRMRERLQAGQLSVVAEAGHTVHLEQPEAFVGVLTTN